MRSFSKYKAVPTIVDNIKFPSKLEARVYQGLKYMLGAGEISELDRQVRFPLVVNGIKICTFVPDFIYTDKAKKRVVLEAKGMETPSYKIKAKLFQALYPEYIYKVVKR